MPKGEKEIHPYLDMGQIKGSQKLILGSFPVYECTDSDNERKQKTRKDEGTVRFFYGSNRNKLWEKYSLYIDSEIQRPWEAESILGSLSKHSIAVSDIIKSCERYLPVTKKNGERSIDGFSSLDTALREKVWNDEGLRSMISDSVVKILCTSKYVLENLESRVICSKKQSIGELDTSASKEFQAEFLKSLGGVSDKVVNDFVKVFTVNGKQVFALAIPSPGSPQRQIARFGCPPESDNLEYAELFFKQAFEWLSK